MQTAPPAQTTADMIWRGPARRSPGDNFNHYGSILIHGNQIIGLLDHVLDLSTNHQVVAQIQDLYEDNKGEKHVVYSTFIVNPEPLRRNANFGRQELFLPMPKSFGCCLAKNLLLCCTLLRVEYRFPSGRGFISPLIIDGDTPPQLNSLTPKYLLERVFTPRLKQHADLDEISICQEHSETCAREICMVPNCLQYKVLARIEHAVLCKLTTGCAMEDCKLDKGFVRNAMQCTCGGKCKTCTAYNKFLRFHEQQCTKHRRGQCTFPRCRNSTSIECERLGGWSIVNPRLLLNKSSRIGKDFQVAALPLCKEKTNAPVDDEVIWKAKRNFATSLPKATRSQCVVDRLVPVSITARGGGGMAWVKIVDAKLGMEEMDVIPSDAVQCANANDKYKLTIPKSSLLLMDRCKEAMLMAYHDSNERERLGLPKVEKPHPMWEAARQLNTPYPLSNCNTLDLLKSTQELYLINSNSNVELNFAYKSRIRQYSQVTSKIAQRFNLTNKQMNDWIYMCSTNQGVVRFADVLKLKCTICNNHTTGLRACSMFAKCEQILCQSCVNLVASATLPANEDFVGHQAWFCPSCSTAALSAKAKHNKISTPVATQRKPAKQTITSANNMIDIFRHYEQGEVSAEDGMAQIRAMMVANAQRTMKIWDNK